MPLPFVSRRQHEAVLADRERIRSERNQFAKDRDTYKSAAETAAEKYTDAAIVNDRLTEELVEVRAKLADSMAVEGALAAQIHVMAGHDLPPEVEMNPMTRVTRELELERERADRLQRQLDDAAGLPPGRVEDSSRWQPGYQQPKPTKETTP
ncbi:hypothetical protein [Streptomyces adelaidensis]|uniref:hypothetical protein n=1 Tax=Streptomyces adelaidensis TaxID=2796465 RepID=UPI0019046834|nr:hypothetical protein [Streptomyces adelaidensis]